MQSLIRSKSAGVTGGRGTAGAGPGRDLLYLTIVNNQSYGSRSWFSNQEAATAVMGVVPLLLLFNEASINTFLNLALDSFNLFLRSGVGRTPHSRLFKFSFEFQVHLDQFFTRKGRRQGAEHLLIG